MEISWVRIDFHDNQPAIDLIEGRPGLIDYLDEQCKVVRGSDDAWLNQISSCNHLKKNQQLQLPRIRSSNFIVKHFAADVCLIFICDLLCLCGFMKFFLACGVLETIIFAFVDGCKALWKDNSKLFAEKACAKTLEVDLRYNLLTKLCIYLICQSSIKIRFHSNFISFIVKKVFVGDTSQSKNIAISARHLLPFRLDFVECKFGDILIGFSKYRKITKKLQIRYEKSAVIIQKHWRGYLVRREQIKRDHNIIKAQSCVRRWLAKRRLRELRRKAEYVYIIHTNGMGRVLSKDYSLRLCNGYKESLYFLQQ
uniref:Myosin motor domain-containing protein n=1 Tax=Heterorhabditis bacteriophora TaxID=37862 RepID=A0A1I7X1S2_HETBA